MFANQQLETVLTTIAEGPPLAGGFAIPAKPQTGAGADQVKRGRRCGVPSVV
jgi:hypothetical protein